MIYPNFFHGLIEGRQHCGKYKFLLRAHISVRNRNLYDSRLNKLGSLGVLSLGVLLESACRIEAVFLSPFPFLLVEPLRQIFWYELVNKQYLWVPYIMYKGKF